MIGQYCFALRSADGAPIPSMMAYRLYGWLLEQLPEDIGRQMHEQGEKPLSQYIRYDKAENRTLWVVSVFQGELYELLEPVLESISCIALRQTTLQAALLDKRCFASAQEFVLYTLKSARIPGFSGHLTLSSSLSAPMQEVRNLLLVFSTLCGIGIKTTLGMGGVTLEISPNSLLKEQEK